MQPLKIVLASESQFRRRAMDMVGVRYETRPASIDEKAIRHDDPEQLTRQLAEAKAWKVAGECPDAVIVSGDAVAAKDGRIYEKPLDLDEAAQFLREFSGNEFQFVTSLAVTAQRGRDFQHHVPAAARTRDPGLHPKVRGAQLCRSLRERRGSKICREGVRRGEYWDGASGEPVGDDVARARGGGLGIADCRLQISD